MCGIIGIISSKEVPSRIVNSLKKLEYRGYDSAGIATLVNGNINEVKCEGRVDVLEKDINKFNLKGEIITSPFSFFAAAYPIKWNGLKLIFVDVYNKYGNLCPADKIEFTINKNTGGILARHNYRFPREL